MNVTYHQLLSYVEKHGLKEAARKVTQVSLGVFEPLENIVLQFSLKGLDIKPFAAKLHNVPLYIQSNDQFVLSPQALSLDDSLNTHYPGEFTYGGAFLIEDLVNKKELDMRVTGYPNDVFERTEVRRTIKLEDMSHAELVVDISRSKAPKAYVNSSDQYKYTENGVVKNNYGTINFRSSGMLQLIYELRNQIDQYFFAGTQASFMMTDNGSLKISGNFGKMNTLYISGLSLKGFGIYLAAGIGAKVKVDGKADILEQIIDNEKREYSVIDIATKKVVGKTALAELKKAHLKLAKRQIKTSSMTSIYLSEKIAELLNQK